MISSLLPLLAAASLMGSPAGAPEMPSRTLEGGVSAPIAFRAPGLAARQTVAFEAPLEKSLEATTEVPAGRKRIGSVRSLAKSVSVGGWTAADGGFVAKLRAASAEAEGLRVKLELGPFPAVIEARVQGNDGRLEMTTLEAGSDGVAWTPWTAGSEQLVELFSPVLPQANTVRIGGVLHFTDSPVAPKEAAAGCTLSTMCTTGNAALDAAITDRKKSVVKISFVDGGTGYICSATLINTERFPAPFLLTANHCVDNAAAASTISTLWFYENTGCGAPTIKPGFVQIAGGAQLVFANYNVDSALLRLNRTPPAGAVYAGWSAARLNSGDAIVSISHPQGDTSRIATGNVTQFYRIEDFPQDEYGVAFTRGIIEGGSSGSGLFTLANGSLQLRGMLTGATGDMTCTSVGLEGLYSRFEIFEPQIDQYIRVAPQAADDAPNRAMDLFSAPFTDPDGVDMPLDQRSAPLSLLNRRIDYPGDLDVYRFRLTQQARVTISSTGPTDTVGSILDSNGIELEASDDAAAGNTNFGITTTLEAGTYYLQVGHWEATGIGPYGLTLSATPTQAATNYTDLWWNPAESGWGINVNHQGNIVFATLFTYDSAGNPMWLVMSDGEKQGSQFAGALYRTTGPAFNAPWSAITSTPVGSMMLTFSGPNTATLEYVVNGLIITKSITRQSFSMPAPTCTWVTTDRSNASNFQDLWWNPAESGWGLNIAHQGNTLFATLFTYDASGRGMWFVMSSGVRTGDNVYGGTLYRTTGPPFTANVWTPITTIPVGTMTLAFANGNSATLTYTVDGVQVVKTIQRQVFSSPLTQCTS